MDGAMDGAMADGPAFCHSPPGEDEDDQEPWFNVVYTCWIVLKRFNCLCCTCAA